MNGCDRCQQNGIEVKLGAVFVLGLLYAFLKTLSHPHFTPPDIFLFYPNHSGASLLTHVHAMAVAKATAAAAAPDCARVTTTKALFGRLMEHAQTADDMNNFSVLFGIRECAEWPLENAIAILDLTGKFAVLPASAQAAKAFADQYAARVGNTAGLNNNRVAAINFRECPF